MVDIAVLNQIDGKIFDFLKFQSQKKNIGLIDYIRESDVSYSTLKAYFNENPQKATEIIKKVLEFHEIHYLNESYVSELSAKFNEGIKYSFYCDYEKAKVLFFEIKSQNEVIKHSLLTGFDIVIDFWLWTFDNHKEHQVFGTISEFKTRFNEIFIKKGTIIELFYYLIDSWYNILTNKNYSISLYKTLDLLDNFKELYPILKQVLATMLYYSFQINLAIDYLKEVFNFCQTKINPRRIVTLNKALCYCYLVSNNPYTANKYLLELKNYYKYSCDNQVDYDINIMDGCLMISIGDNQKAYEQFKRIIVQFENKKEAWVYLAFCIFRLKKKEEIEALLKSVKEINQSYQFLIDLIFNFKKALKKEKRAYLLKYNEMKCLLLNRYLFTMIDRYIIGEWK